MVKTVRKFLRATLVKGKNSLDYVNAAILAQIHLSCALLHPLSAHTILPNISALKLLHSSSSVATKCLPWLP